MNILISGAGAAGLMFALWLEVTAPGRHRVTILDCAGPDERPGHGITLSDTYLDGIGVAKFEVAPFAIHLDGRELALLQEWHTSSVSRRDLIGKLTSLCKDRGVLFEYNVGPDEALRRASEYDLVVGADGAGSSIRQHIAESVGLSLTVNNTKFAWVGCKTALRGMRLSGKRTDTGSFLLWGYPYTAGASTVIVQCSEKTLDRLSARFPTATERFDFLSDLFEHELEGARIEIPGKEKWTSFRRVETELAHHGNFALIGDALHTVHFSLGQGTYLALEDAVQLAEAMEEEPQLPAALDLFWQTRKPAILETQKKTTETMELCDQALQALDRDDVEDAKRALTSYSEYLRGIAVAPAGSTEERPDTLAT